MPLRKLFIGRLPDDTTQEDLERYFREHGDLTDVYIPSPFRGFGFVTFSSSEVAREVLHMNHTFKVFSMSRISLLKYYGRLRKQLHSQMQVKCTMQCGAV